jgi:hypothetical protein
VEFAAYCKGLKNANFRSTRSTSAPAKKAMAEAREPVTPFLKAG